MKITKSKIRKIIKEEISRLKEGVSGGADRPTEEWYINNALITGGWTKIAWAFDLEEKDLDVFAKHMGYEGIQYLPKNPKSVPSRDPTSYEKWVDAMSAATESSTEGMMPAFDIEYVLSSLDIYKERPDVEYREQEPGL